MTDTKAVAEFLKYAQPNSILDEVRPPSWLYHYKWNRMKAIADGDVRTKDVWEEHFYEGDMTPRQLGVWLMQWDNSWTVQASEDGEISISRYKTLPLSEAEIEEAVRFIEANPEPPPQEAVKFRPPLRTNFSTEDWT